MIGDVAQAAVHQVKSSLLDAIERGEPITLRHEADVYRAIDTLRRAPADPALVAQVERLSCMMRPMPHLLQQGRVNAYASATLRLRSAALSL